MSIIGKLTRQPGQDQQVPHEGEPQPETELIFSFFKKSVTVLTVEKSKYYCMNFEKKWNVLPIDE